MSFTGLNPVKGFFLFFSCTLVEYKNYYTSTSKNSKTKCCVVEQNTGHVNHIAVNRLLIRLQGHSICFLIFDA